MLAEHRHRDETCFIEQSRSLRRVTMNELGAELDWCARVRYVERHDATPDAVACLEQAHILTRATELTCRHQSSRTRSDDDCVERTGCIAHRTHTFI